MLANAISDDGSTVVGDTISDRVGCVFSSTFQEYKVTAFRWTEQGGLASLDAPDNRIHSWATDVSADGSIVAGYASSQDLEDPTVAVMWNDEGVHILGPMPDDWSRASASYVSADGKTIVGTSAGSFGSVADEWFRWTDADGFVQLPKLSPDQRGLPLAVSADAL